MAHFETECMRSKKLRAIQLHSMGKKTTSSGPSRCGPFINLTNERRPENKSGKKRLPKDAEKKGKIFQESL
jgi:hypothetical protein